MSDPTALALTITSFFLGVFTYLYVIRWAHSVTVAIISGVIGGMPVPPDWRWLMLYNKWFPLLATAVAGGAFVSGVNMKIASLSEDPGVKAVGYLVALFAALVALGCLLGGAAEFAYLRSVLRQAEAH
jgi:hypothetical protein